MRFMTALGLGEREQDCALLPRPTASKVAVDRTFGTLIGKVASPSTQVSFGWSDHGALMVGTGLITRSWRLCRHTNILSLNTDLSRSRRCFGQDVKQMITATREHSHVEPLVVVGWIAIICGGLVAAVTAPLDLQHGSWSAAFLVLIAGVAQVWLGSMQAVLTGRRLPRSTVWTQMLIWSAGCAAVIAGTWWRLPILVDVGGVLLVAALVWFIATVKGRGQEAVWLRRGYIAVCTIVLVSIPVGLVLGHLRAS